MLPETIDVPNFVRGIATRLDAEGYEVWCVGGVVRDVALGERCTDVDLATSAHPADVQRLFRRTVPVGIAHGTVAVLDDDNQLHEVTTFRRDVSTDGRHATVEFGVSLEEDLARRDFTINAIAFHPLTSEYRDPFNGQADLEAGIVRAVGEPRKRFTEDYLRILRALRFASRFDFKIEGETWSAAIDLIEETRMLSAERVRDEWFGGLKTARTVTGLIEMWREVGALRVWLHELDTENVDWADRLVTTERLVERDPVLISALLTDEAANVLRRLKAPNAAIDRTEAVARFDDEYPSGGDPEQTRRWLSSVGPAADDLIDVAEARGHEPDLRRAVAAVRTSNAPLTVGDLRLNGKDLGTIGVRSGPGMGIILKRLLDDVLKDPSRNSVQWLTARTRELMADD